MGAYRGGFEARRFPSWSRPSVRQLIFLILRIRYYLARPAERFEPELLSRIVAVTPDLLLLWPACRRVLYRSKLQSSSRLLSQIVAAARARDSGLLRQLRQGEPQRPRAAENR
jgi:hypothetical protein